MFNRSRTFCAVQILFVTLALATLVAAQSNSLFTAVSLTPVGSDPVAIASGDFNGDGFTDRAVANALGNSVSILLGTGDGNFQPAVNYPVGESPIAIVAGDFNRDGHIDLAVANYGDPVNGGSVSILLGRGDGTFAAGASYAILAPQAIVVGDFYGDGNMDLAVMIDSYNGNLYANVFRGNGDGTFQIGQDGYVGTGVGLGALAVGDVNGDGKPDLITYSTVDGSSFIGTLVSNGSAGVGCMLGVPGRVSIAVGDFNNDGKLDVAVAFETGHTIAICLGNGDGTFTLGVSAAVGNNPLSLAAGDFNGDGKIDLVASNSSDGTVSVLLGKGDGTFANGVTYPVGNQPSALALTDLNGDGKLDLTVVNAADTNVQALLGRGDGTFFVGTYRVAASGSSQVASGDFNNDGIPDLALFNLDGTITVLLGDGHGGFRVSSTFLGCLAEGSPAQIVVADFDGDGKSDLAISCTPTELNVFAGKGDGSFQLEFQLGEDSVPIVNILAADVNGDGIAELIVVFSDGEFSCNIPSGDCLEFLQTGDNLGLQAGDFNGDGKLDFLVLQNGGQTVALGDGVLAKFGTGNFQLFPLQGSADSALVGDFNGDGFSDTEFETAPGGVFQMQVTLSNGDGTFRNGFQYSSNRFGVPQPVADFNGDGILDLLSFGNGGPFGVFFGKDDGTFADSGIPSIPFGSRSAAAIADFDGDGSPDVAIVDSNTGVLSILINKNSFQSTNTVLSGSSGTVVAGGPITLSAAVGTKQGTPTGNVVFKQGGVPQTTAALSSGVATATFDAESLAGTQGFTALYTGDGTFSGSLSQRLLVTVSAASTTTSVASSAPSSKLGQSVTFTATVHPQYSGQPTGTVEFYADGNPIGSATVSGGQAALGTSSLTLGTHTIQADYSGDSSFTTSLGSAKQKVGDAASSIQLTSSLNPAVYGQAVTLTATVTDSAGSTPTGVVVFEETGTYYGTVTLTGGVAQIVLPTTLAAGKHTITAQYSGDSTDGPAKASLAQVITGAPSTTTITTDTQPSIYGQTVTFTAIVSSTSGTPDGTVTFKNGTAVLGIVALSGGQATYAISTLNGGTLTIKALYNGSSSYGTSSASLFQIVEPASTTTTLTSSLNPAPYGQTVTFTAVVTSAASSTPSGTVTIKDGKKALGSGSLVNGQIQISTALLAKGGHTLTATYAGSANFSTSTSSLSQGID